MDPKQIEQWLREELWFNHGCEHHYFYGDDGEMQCQNMTRHPGLWDFKRTPIEELRQEVCELRLRTIAEAMTNNDPKASL